MVIRRFRQDDLGTVTAMWSALNKHAHAQSADSLFQEDPAAFEKEAARRFALIMAHDEHSGFLAESDTAIVGLAVAYVQSYPWMAVKRVGCIAAVWVAPGHRRDGVGRALVERVEAWFGSRSVAHVTLTWMEQNREAGCFWDSLGYAVHSLTAGKLLS